VDQLEYCEAIRREGAALAAAARDAGVDARVPSCPEWTIADLLGHVGRIHRWVTAIVEQRPGATEHHWSESEPPAVEERIEWFAGGVDPLADALAAADPETEVWTWTDDRTVGFWARRQANETAVHRWDAELAAGHPEPIAGDLAVDGIDERLAILPSWRGVDQLRSLRGTIHLHCTDADGEWLLRFDDGIEVTHEHAKGDVAVRGPASDLLLVLYGRAEPSTLELFGDAALFEDFLTRSRW
jgi:uncharacterized protein (TIGR03083 family)